MSKNVQIIINDFCYINHKLRKSFIGKNNHFRNSSFSKNKLSKRFNRINQNFIIPFGKLKQKYSNHDRFFHEKRNK